MNTRVEPLRAGLGIVVVMSLLGLLVMLMPMTAFGGHAVLAPDAEGCVKVDEMDDLTAGEFPITIVLSGQDGPVTFDLTGGDQKEGEVTGEWISIDYGPITGLAEGESVVVTEIKTGNDNQGPETLDPAGGTIDIEGTNAISHLTFCLEFDPPPPTTTTTTVADTTTTTVADTTTTTVADTTTTTVADTTTTTIEDEVLGTVITTTTIVDEVLDTHVEAEELPFTGIDSELLVGMGVLLLMSGLLVLGVTGKREDA